MLSFILASALAALKLEHGKRPFVFIFPSCVDSASFKCKPNCVIEGGAGRLS